MCQEKNIENVCQIVQALELRHNEKMTVRPVILTGDFWNNYDGANNVMFYGILSVGTDSVFEIYSFKDLAFEVSGPSQIIECINSIGKNGVEDNIWFRGYEITAPTADIYNT